MPFGGCSGKPTAGFVLQLDNVPDNLIVLRFGLANVFRGANHIDLIFTLDNGRVFFEIIFCAVGIVNTPDRGAATGCALNNILIDFLPIQLTVGTGCERSATLHSEFGVDILIITGAVNCRLTGEAIAGINGQNQCIIQVRGLAGGIHRCKRGNRQQSEHHDQRKGRRQSPFQNFPHIKQPP